MSVKDVRKLKEQCEAQKEELKTLAKVSKENRTESRRIETDIKKKIQEIANLDAKKLKDEKDARFIVVGGKKVRHKHSSRKDHNKYSEAFQEIITAQLFENIPEKPKGGNSEETLSKIMIDVEFEKVRISFFINHSTRFRDLRQQVASYWSLPIEEIFFSDEEPEIGNQALLLLDNVIIDEVYIWRRIKLKGVNFVLHLVLRNYISLNERMEQMFPKNEELDKSNSDTEDIALNLISNKKVKKEKVINKLNGLKIRKNWFLLSSFIQSLMLVALFLMWAFLLVTEMNISQVTWVNKALEKQLLWDFEFYSTANSSMFGIESESALMHVSDIKQFYKFMDYLEHVFYGSNTGPGVISNSLYSIDTVQVRQLRTALELCNNTYIGVYNCTTDYTWYKTSYKSDLGPESFQIYQDKSSGVFIYGSLSLYPLSGYIMEMPVKDHTKWTSNLFALKNTDWVDEGTRVIFVQTAFINPSSNTISMILAYFEITSSGVYIPNFHMYSLQTPLYTNFRLAIHIIIIAFALILIIYEIRDNIRFPDELEIYRNFSQKIEEKSEIIYDKIAQHKKKGFWKRLRKPKPDEVFSFITLTIVIAIEIASYGWFATHYTRLTKEPSNHRVIYLALQGFAMTNDSRTIVTLLLATNIIRIIIIWFNKATIMFRILTYSISQYMYYAIFCMIPLFAFAIHYFYFLGPYDNAFNSLEKALVSTIRIFIGQWPSNIYFFKFVDSGYLVVLHFLFIIWRMIVVNFQIIIFQNKLSYIKQF